MHTNKMRAASFLLPPPGGAVVRECLGEIDELRVRVAGLEGECLVAQAKQADAERRLVELQEAVPGDCPLPEGGRMSHLCDTFEYTLATCDREPLFGIDFYDGDVAYTAKADEVVKCDKYEVREA